MDATQEEGVPVAAVPDPRTTPTMHVEQAAELLDVSRASAYKAVATGEIPSIRIGKRILVPTAALLDMLGLRAS
jgi:excisionase family DNA binding protein